MRTRLRKKIHTKYIDDVVCEISQAKGWREVLFSLPADQRLEISRESEIPLPVSLRETFKRNPLVYLVSVSPSDSMIIFEFSPRSFPEVKRFSYNKAPRRNIPF
mgnify:CR=1 FL=1